MQPEELAAKQQQASELQDDLRKQIEEKKRVKVRHMRLSLPFVAVRRQATGAVHAYANAEIKHIHCLLRPLPFAVFSSEVQYHTKDVFLSIQDSTCRGSR